MTAAGRGPITTEIEPLGDGFFFAEDHHQQYLEKHPNGYRCHAATGVPFPTGVNVRGGHGSRVVAARS